MKKFDAVVFDMDGVIFDSEMAVMKCWLEIAEKYGIKDIEEPYLACTGTNAARTKEIMLEAYGEDFPYDLYAKEASEMYHERYDGGRLPVKPGVTEILDFLKAEKKKIALASSTRRETVINQLRDANILDYFDEVITGDMVQKSKPEPDIFLLACERLGVDPENAYAIEDSYNGIRSAFRGGLMPIMVPDLIPADNEMRRCAVAVIDDLEGVASYLKGIRIIDSKLKLIPYYPCEDITLKWYQDPVVCRQVDNIDHVYDLEMLRRMYSYLDSNGSLFYIEYEGKIVGDVSLRDNSEVAIVICKDYQNMHIGRRCIYEMIRLAREKKMTSVKANIYSFNEQSKTMFMSLGFEQTDDEWYEYRI
ncbi:HAD-IA family hydrolase [Butyrivibrio sp.]|uniref:HAD-IA family hydrolase n=1 Tax=Butyrivibrio sp. TaxID=28121 RepID=UPI0025BC6A79|nr:HAD-IA family hydrolase [Butyrivibrio sp.]